MSFSMLNNLNIKGLFLVVGLMALLAIAMGLSALNGMEQSNDSLRTIYLDRTVGLRQLTTPPFSITKHFNPFFCASMATESPDGPAPTTMTSIIWVPYQKKSADNSTDLFFIESM